MSAAALVFGVIVGLAACRSASTESGADSGGTGAGAGGAPSGGAGSGGAGGQRAGGAGAAGASMGGAQATGGATGGSAGGAAQGGASGRGGTGAGGSAGGGASGSAGGGAGMAGTGGVVPDARPGVDAPPPPPPAPAGSTLFPNTSPWYQDITNAPLDAESQQVIEGLQRRGWGTGVMRIDFTIEVLRADPGLAGRAFTKTNDFYTPDCDDVPFPVPPVGRLEGEPNYACAGDGDCHLIVLQGAKLFEMWRANLAGGTSTGAFRGGCAAVWDLTKDYWRPATPPAPFARGDQCTSADAAGYPIAALLFTADEVKAGAINHAVRFILPNGHLRKGQYVHPATHSGAGKGTPTPDTVPYGARLRLKRTFDLARLPNEGARTLARALQKHGMFLADGGNIALTGQADTYTTAKWQGLLGSQDMRLIQPSDFEMVDGGTRIPLTLDCKRSGW